MVKNRFKKRRKKKKNTPKYLLLVIGLHFVQLKLQFVTGKLESPLKKGSEPQYESCRTNWTVKLAHYKV